RSPTRMSAGMLRWRVNEKGWLTCSAVRLADAHHKTEPALPNVGDQVGSHVRQTCPHDGRKAQFLRQGWRLLTNPGQGFHGHAVPDSDRKAYPFKNVDCFGLCQQEARPAALGPRHWKEQLRFAVCHEHIIEGELATGLQHATELAVDPLPIVDIH